MRPGDTGQVRRIHHLGRGARHHGKVVRCLPHRHDDDVTDTEPMATLIVWQDRQWAGSPGLGAFVAYIDGKRTGVVPVQGRLTINTSPGHHVIRIRQWWFASAPEGIELAGGETVKVQADISRSDGSLRRYWRFLLTPWKALAVSPER